MEKYKHPTCDHRHSLSHPTYLLLWSAIVKWIILEIIDSFTHYFSFSNNEMFITRQILNHYCVALHESAICAGNVSISPLLFYNCTYKYTARAHTRLLSCFVAAVAGAAQLKFWIYVLGVSSSSTDLESSCRNKRENAFRHHHYWYCTINLYIFIIQQHFYVSNSLGFFS